MTAIHTVASNLERQSCKHYQKHPALSPKEFEEDYLPWLQNLYTIDQDPDYDTAIILAKKQGLSMITHRDLWEIKKFLRQKKLSEVEQEVIA